MSYTWRQVNESANIPITSMRALAAAMQASSIQFVGQMAFLREIAAAEQALARAQAHLESMSAMSLEDVIEMENAIEAVIQANADLHAVQQRVESIALPNQLSFKHNNRSYTLNQVAGAYRLTWTERVAGSQRRRDEGARTFARELSDAYSKGVKAHRRERTQAASAYGSLNAEHRARLEQAGRIRTRWEAIAEKRKLEALVQKQVAHIEERVKAQGPGWQMDVTETEEEVIVRTSIRVGQADGATKESKAGGFMKRGGGGFLKR